MIMLEIVVKIAHQIKPLLYCYSKGLLCYAFLMRYIITKIKKGYFNI